LKQACEAEFREFAIRSTWPLATPISKWPEMRRHASVRARWPAEWPNDVWPNDGVLVVSFGVGRPGGLISCVFIAAGLRARSATERSRAA
jgi:hypothetical protein